VASTGNVFPTAAASVDRAGSAAWNNPTNVFSDNATSATQAVAGVADYLVTSGYGFAIPTNATILGVTVRVEASETGSGSATYTPQLHSATTPTLVGSAKSPVTVTTGPTISTNGSATDLWGATLTPAIVNDAGFGVSIWSVDTGNTLSIDYVTIAIEYSLPTDDGDVSWWAGTNLSGAKVAIAGGAAALVASVAIAGGFNFNDEIGTAVADLGFGGTAIERPQPGIRLQRWPQADELPVAAEVVTGSGAGTTAQPPTPRAQVLRWPQADELPVAAAPSFVVDDGWQQWPTAQTTAPRLFAAADDFAPPAAPSFVIDEGWQRPWPVVQSVAPLVFTDADSFKPSAAAALTVDDDQWLRLQPIAQPALPLLWWDREQFVPPSGAPNAGGGHTRQAPTAAPRIVRWAQDDSLPVAATPLTIDDESRPPPRAPLVDPTSVVWAENDDFPQQSAGAATRFEDEAFNPAPKIAGVNGIVWATDDELPRRFTPREDYWHRVYSIRVDPVVRVWLQQDERETAAAPLQVVDDDRWLPYTIPVPPRHTLWATTDEIEQAPAPLQVVDDDHWRAFSVPVAPTVTLWATDEPIVPVPATLAVEDYWQAPFTVRVLPIAWVGEHQDERETVPAPLEVDDEYWQKPPHIVPPFDLRIWSDDDPLVPYVAPVVVHGRRGSPVKGGPGRSFTYPERSSNTSKTRRK
jgi:hypothetical protein